MLERLLLLNFSRQKFIFLLLTIADFPYVRQQIDANLSSESVHEMSFFRLIRYKLYTYAFASI
jgi:hypothetical protein